MAHVTNAPRAPQEAPRDFSRMTRGFVMMCIIVILTGLCLVLGEKIYMLREAVSTLKAGCIAP